MKIELTPEQYKQLKEEQWLDIRINELEGQSLYLEFRPDMSFVYGEIHQTRIPGYKKAFVFDDEDLKKMIPEKPSDPSYYHDCPLCPRCGTYMIYNFEHCPKCGQEISWSEFTGER